MADIITSIKKSFGIGTPKEDSKSTSTSVLDIPGMQSSGLAKQTEETIRKRNKQNEDALKY